MSIDIVFWHSIFMYDQLNFHVYFMSENFFFLIIVGSENFDNISVLQYKQEKSRFAA